MCGVKLCGQLDLPAESLELISAATFSGELDHHLAVEDRFGREKDATHPSTAKLALYSVGPRKPSGSALSPMLIAGLGLSGFWLLLGVTGVLSTFGLALFLVVLSWAVLAVAQACRELWDPTDALRSARRVVSFIVVLALPVAFDPGTAERYGVSKFTVLMIGALVLAGLWIVDAVTNVTIPSLRTGLHWPILAMVVVGGLATIFSVSPKLSLIGAYQSYDGYLALVSFAVLALVAAESWRPSDLRRILTTFLLASGGLVVLYGLIQTADVELSTHWDWIQFLNVQASFGPTSSVWSTFGNPNHLAGFVACLLPIGIIVVISDKSLVTRILAGAVLAGGLLCLVETSSLGGLGAGFGALVLTALLLIPELRGQADGRMAGRGRRSGCRRRSRDRRSAGNDSDTRSTPRPKWSSGTSTAAQRVQFWHSAVDMAADRPLLGWGPDTFGYMAPTYQTQKFVDAFGPDQVINGAHNTFAQTLATKGILGLAALLFFLAWLGLRSWGGWRHVRARERANPEWREQRLVLTAAIGAAVGVLLQNSFNVEILGINVVLWAMAAAVSVVALGAGVPVGLNPAAILRVEPAEEAVPLEAPRRPHRRPTRRGSIALPLGIATVVVLALSWFASTWWRADRSYQLAVEGSAVLAQPDSSSAEQTRALNSTLKAFRDAAKQNTVESRYPLTEATFQLGVLAAANALNTDNVQALAQTEGLLQNTIDRGPRDPVSLASYGRLLARLPRALPGQW